MKRASILSCGLALVAVGALLLTSLAWSADPSAPTTAEKVEAQKRAKAAENLTSIGKALELYRKEYGGESPADLGRKADAAGPAVALASDKAVAAADAQAELPVTRVVLFSSGVGYFEHTGTVDGNAQTRLMFKTEQINDVLKSMIVTDAGGGTIQRIGYGSKEPLERALKSFGVDLSGSPSLFTLLHQLRGAEVIVTGSSKLAGKVFDVEMRTKVHQPGAVQEREDILDLFVEGSGVQQIPLNTVGSVRLADEKLDSELNKALSLLVASRDKDRKPVDIVFAGKGQRKVRIGYIIETPIWKTSYRLDLTGEKAAPRMQGWAVVDNTTDSDWANVGLSLVSGRPISFVQDLYTPLYVPRPMVVPELYASLQPRTYDEGLAEGKEVRTLAAAPAGLMGPTARPADGRYRRSDPKGDASKDMPAAERAEGAGGGFAYARESLDKLDDALTLAGTSVQSLATAAKVGELTRYDLTDPVTLARRGSAMLPIIADVAIKAEKVSIYNQAVMAKYPLNGAYLTNDTKLTLLAGPITVLDGGMYAGDARLDNVTAGEKRLISYAIDLNVAVDPSASSTTALTAAKVVRGVLQLTRKTTFKHEYAIHNKADQPRTMIIEHPFSADRKLIDPKEAEEKTAAVYRFRVPVKAGETGKFPVVEERSDSQTVEILPATPDYLAAFVSGTEIPKAVKDALAKAITLKNELAQLQSRQATLAQQMNVLKTDQARLRENVKTFGADSPNGKTFAKKLMDSETEIEKLDGQVKELTDQIKAKQKELADYLNVLNIE